MSDRVKNDRNKGRSQTHDMHARGQTNIEDLFPINNSEKNLSHTHDRSRR